ncbi:hypothetical protein C8Q76DRAFT_758530 [Earliella scabrosa]|nr:hypothetical protein C8Q76DRAFT_758530 [Earliella scabrosa]
MKLALRFFNGCAAPTPFSPSPSFAHGLLVWPSAPSAWSPGRSGSHPYGADGVVLEGVRTASDGGSGAPPW